MKGGIEAAKMRHEVVMSPTTFAYLDYMQSDEVMEPQIYASLGLKRLTSLNRFPKTWIRNISKAVRQIYGLSKFITSVMQNT